MEPTIIIFNGKMFNVEPTGLDHIRYHVITPRGHMKLITVGQRTKRGDLVFKLIQGKRLMTQYRLTTDGTFIELG